MKLDKKDFYTKESVTVQNVKQGLFKTVIADCYRVNGSKYRPEKWTKDIFEVVTPEGTFMSKYDLSEHIGTMVQVYTNINTENNRPLDIIWWWINLDK